MEINEEFIQELRQYVLAKTGKLYFGRIKSTPKNLMVSCPYHKEGQEHKPSFGIRVRTDADSTMGTCHCFTCGVVKDLSEVVKDLLGSAYDEDEVEARFEIQTSMARETVIQETTRKPLFQLKDKSSMMSENDLRYFRKYHPYLANRKITEQTAITYDIGYDEKNNHITFPIRDIKRRCLGLGRRAINEKQYIYPIGFTKPLYGVFELPPQIRHLWVVEGPFNLWSLFQYNKSGVALLGTGTSYQYKLLLGIKCNDYVLALDGDDAGRKGIYKLGNFLTENKKKVYVAVVPDNQDINDMTQQQFQTMVVTPFYEWKKYYKF